MKLLPKKIITKVPNIKLSLIGNGRLENEYKERMYNDDGFIS